MSLNKSQLESDLNDVFASMSDGDNSVFSDGISEALVAFVSGGSVTTVDAGTISAGVFSGGGSGSISVEPTACAKIIKDACDAMLTMPSGGNDYLAEELGKGIQKMADDAVVTTSVSGTVTPPSGSSYTMSGSAKGTITCDKTDLVTALKALFVKMYNDREEEGYDGNADFAKELASEVYTYYTNGQVKTDGQGALSGSKGAGAVA